MILQLQKCSGDGSIGEAGDEIVRSSKNNRQRLGLQYEMVHVFAVVRSRSVDLDIRRSRFPFRRFRWNMYVYWAGNKKTRSYATRSSDRKDENAF